nr:MAG TPA: RNA-directed RNA polymerase L [Caudoviricetes sp.]DAR07741.1 MAG TPA: RNA-directed RNA polymerase L [Caudoviricetes sp.]
MYLVGDCFFRVLLVCFSLYFDIDSIIYLRIDYAVKLM